MTVKFPVQKVGLEKKSGFFFQICSIRVYKK